MDLGFATDLAFAVLQRLQSNADVSNPPAQPSSQPARRSSLFKRLWTRPARHDPGSPQPFSAYRKSGLHNTLRTQSIGVYDRWIVTLREAAPGVIRLRMRDINDRRDRELEVDAGTEADVSAAIEVWHQKIEWWRARLSVYKLQPGTRYRVIQSFADYHGQKFEAGTILTFVERHFLPYEGGHTIIFTEANVYLQETKNGLILNDFDAYVEEMS